MNFSLSGRIKPAYLSSFMTWRFLSMLFLCFPYMLVYSWQKGQMECIDCLVILYICLCVCEHKYSVVWYVWVFETAMSENFCVTSEFHFCFEFISIMCISWYTGDKINVMNFILHLTIHLKAPDSRILSIGSILCCMLSAILIYGMINTVSCFCRFLHLYILFILQDTKT